ncbi:SPASM domain-containing protein, partial [bacterium]|nr:SPASM domain-containing protein [bacterium]
ILEESLEMIWNNSSVFRTMRSLRIEACETCPRFDICHGGCPAVAFFLKNELNCPDPECICQVHLQRDAV